MYFSKDYPPPLFVTSKKNPRLMFPFHSLYCSRGDVEDPRVLIPSVLRNQTPSACRGVEWRALRKPSATGARKEDVKSLGSSRGLCTVYSSGSGMLKQTLCPGISASLRHLGASPASRCHCRCSQSSPVFWDTTCPLGLVAYFPD